MCHLCSDYSKQELLEFRIDFISLGQWKLVV